MAKSNVKVPLQDKIKKYQEKERRRIIFLRRLIKKLENEIMEILEAR